MKFNWVKRIILFGVVVCIAMLSTAQTVSDSVVIYFRINEVKLDLDYGSNRASLDRIKNILNQNYNDSASWNLRKVVVTGEASPEGPVRMNRNLAKQRAESLFNYITTLCAVPDSLKTMQIVDSDWESLLRMAEADPNLPMRQQTLESIRTIAVQASKSESLRNQSILQLKKLGGGAPYKYICTHFLPLQRKSMIHLYYNKISQPVLEVTFPADATPVNVVDSALVEEPVVTQDVVKEQPVQSVAEPIQASSREIFFLKSNLLLPLGNIGVEVPLGNRWSVGADFYYPWLKRKSDHKNCIQALMWNLEGRYWLGNNRTKADVLEGHSVGFNVMAGYYDFEKNYEGYQGEFVNFSFDYTYGMPIFKDKLHLEFTIGLGYFFSQADKYDVFEEGGKGYRRSYKENFRYLGPNKMGVSIVVPIKSGGRK